MIYLHTDHEVYVARSFNCWTKVKDFSRYCESHTCTVKVIISLTDY